MPGLRRSAFYLGITVSITAIKVVMKATGLSATQKLVLFCYAEHADEKGQHTWPGVPRLVIETGLGDRAIRNAIKALRKKKILIETKSSTQHYPTEYRIDLRKLQKMAHPDLQEMHPKSTRPAPDAPLETPDLHLIPSRPALDAPEPPLTIKKEGETDPFSQVQDWIETAIGTPITPTKAEVTAINKMIELKTIEPDIINAVAFFKDNGRVARGAAHLLESVKYQIRQRTQKDTKSVKPPAKEEVWAEVWE